PEVIEDVAPPPPLQPAVVPQAVVIQDAPLPSANPWSAFDAPGESPPSPRPVAVPVPVAQPKPATRKPAVVLDEDEDDEPAPARKKSQSARKPAATSAERTGPGMGFY